MERVRRPPGPQQAQEPDPAGREQEPALRGGGAQDPAGHGRHQEEPPRGQAQEEREGQRRQQDEAGREGARDRPRGRHRAHVPGAPADRAQALGVGLHQVRHDGAQAEHGGREEDEGAGHRPRNEAEQLARHPGNTAAHDREHAREARGGQDRGQRHAPRVGQAAAPVAAQRERAEHHPDDRGPRHDREPVDGRHEPRARDLDREHGEARPEREQEEPRAAGTPAAGGRRGFGSGAGSKARRSFRGQAARPTRAISSRRVVRPRSLAYQRRITL